MSIHICYEGVSSYYYVMSLQCYQSYFKIRILFIVNSEYQLALQKLIGTWCWWQKLMTRTHNTRQLAYRMWQRQLVCERKFSHLHSTAPVFYADVSGLVLHKVLKIIRLYSDNMREYMFATGKYTIEMVLVGSSEK